MPEKIVEQILESRLFAPFVSFVGVAIMLLWSREMSRGRVAVAVLAAPTFSFLIVPMAMSYLRSVPALAWLPHDGSIEGLLGFVIGMVALNLVALVLRAGGRAEAGAGDRLFGGKQP
jgi:hypothetical protein